MKRRSEKQSGDQDRDPLSGLGARVAVGGLLAFGALASGFLLSRSGRRLVVDTFKGARRTPLADRVLERLWEEPMLGRRRVDTEEPVEGTVAILGSVATDRERALALEVAASVEGVIEVQDRLVLDPTLIRRRARSEKDLVGGS